METASVKAFGTGAADKPLQVMQIERREPLPHDVEIKILYCGICHSDLHTVRDEWDSTTYPVVPGHEIVGKVTRVGGQVTKFKAGDLAAVGCIVDSCRECAYCRRGDEQFCEEGWTVVFNSDDRILGGQTYGGFSERIVVDENYVLHMPEKLDLAAAAPLLCAGITVYSPLKHWATGPGKKVGIIGLGGLGHLAIRIAKAMGAHVTVFSTSAAKVKDARRLGADEVALFTDSAQMKHRPKLDLILDTAPGAHKVDPFLTMLKVDGSLVLVGLPGDPLPVDAFHLVHGRKNFAGSNIGGISETQEMLDFCADHNITADVELIQVHQVNEALDRLAKGDVRYRFVIDLSSL